jgi:hypothetical protein
MRNAKKWLLYAITNKRHTSHQLKLNMSLGQFTSQMLQKTSKNALLGEAVILPPDHPILFGSQWRCGQ